MVFITRSEINRMKKNVIDNQTGMTEFDHFEYQNCYEDWEIIEDVKDGENE